MDARMDAWIISSLIWIWFGITRPRYPPWRVYHYKCKKEGEKCVFEAAAKRGKRGKGLCI